MPTPTAVPGSSSASSVTSPVATPLAADVLALASYWAESIRVAFGLRYITLPFSGPAPWASSHPQTRRRWATFVAMTSRLQACGVDPREFCTAIAEHHARFNRGVRPRLPNPQQCSGEWGLKIWRRWRAARIADAAGSSRRLLGARILGVEPRREALVRQLRAVFAQIKNDGIEYALSMEWGPEVLWIVAQSEPVAIPILQARYLTLPPGKLRDAIWRGWNRINKSDTYQAWLMQARRDATDAAYGEEL